jgi:MYXO-CTERM domain-containing protein
MTRMHCTTRLTTIALLAAATATTVASADLIYENLPTSTLGSISESFSSNGSYAFGQSCAQRFSVEDSYNLSSLSWWGSSQNFSGGDLSNFSAFEVVIWNADFSAQVTSFNISLGSITTTPTGLNNFFGSPEYQFSAAINGVLGAGVYNINIGAVMANGQGDEFIWSAGAEQTGRFFTSPSNPWGTWKELPPGIGDDGFGSVRLEGSLVPAPGAIALLGLAGLVGRRRRA